MTSEKHLTIADKVTELKLENPLVAITDKPKRGKVAYGYYDEIPDRLKTKVFRHFEVLPGGANVLLFVVDSL